MGDDDAVEVPLEDALEARARGGPILDEPRIELRRAEHPVAAHQFHEEARWRSRARAEVEREVAEDERAARAVEEDDLVLVRAAAEEDLSDRLAPFHRRLVAEHGLELQVRPLALEPGADPQARLGVHLRYIAGVQMMHAVRRDHVAHPADGVELAAELRV